MVETNEERLFTSGCFRFRPEVPETALTALYVVKNRSCHPHRSQKKTRITKMAAIKFGSHIKELRILLCQTSKSSQGVR